MMRLTLADAVKFHLAGDPMSGTPVFAEKRKWAPDERWAVTRAGSCLNKGGGWEYEPSPSSRTEAFFERTRWATAEAAAEAYLATQAERERASLARGSGPGNSADREGTHAPSHPIPPSVSAAHFDQPSDGDLYLSDRETLEKLLRDVDTERFKSGFGLISFEESDAIRRLLEENEQLKADADRVAAACNVEMADLRTRWNAAEARIDAALAAIDPTYFEHQDRAGLIAILDAARDALKGEK